MDEAARAPFIDWLQIKYEYEMTDESAASIYRRHGATKGQFDRKMRDGNWVSRRATRAARLSSILDRLLLVLERQASRLENNEVLGELEVKQLSEAIKNFEKVANVKIGEGDTGGPAGKKDLTDLRDKLAKRIDQSKRR